MWNFVSNSISDSISDSIYVFHDLCVKIDTKGADLVVFRVWFLDVKPGRS
jgi:hypothetical protein